MCHCMYRIIFSNLFSDHIHPFFFFFMSGPLAKKTIKDDDEKRKYTSKSTFPFRASSLGHICYDLKTETTKEEKQEKGRRKQKLDKF